ncbi:hypothetical protein [Lysobacter hankyongensis]|uniref:TIR domain-containing protein n=1 Tax=Lysobacter hankyongensis TaxID=1176535 RepID=A0ABP9BXN2_9GAMM
MPQLEALRHIQAFAARAPANPEDLNQLLHDLCHYIKKVFSAHIVDVVWEDSGNLSPSLFPLKVAEDENNNFSKRAVLKDGKPTSLTAYSYQNDLKIWITNRDGLKSSKQHLNQFTDSEFIESSLIFHYATQKTIRTEICIPLHVTLPKGGKRVSGIVNIESTEHIQRTEMASMYAVGFAQTIEQIVTRWIASQAAESWSNQQLRKLTQLSLQNRIEPGAKLGCFIVHDFVDFDVRQHVRWAESVLEDAGIEVLRLGTVGAVVEEIMEKMRMAHFGIVFSSDTSRNVQWEWGFLVALGRPIIRLEHPKGDSRGDFFDVRGTQRFDYGHNYPDGKKEDAFKLILKEALKLLLNQHKEWQPIHQDTMESEK